MRDSKNADDFMKKTARAEGRAEGRVETRYEIAGNMINMGIDLRVICEATGLSEEEILKLKE